MIEQSWLQVIPVAGAGLAYGIAAPLGGSGFIAAFVAGMTFGLLLRRPADGGEVTFLTDELGELLNGVTLLVFGAVLLWPALDGMTWRIGLYAVASLTVVRMLPVAVAMLGTGARRPTVAFLGWFGPRGLASIVPNHNPQAWAAAARPCCIAYEASPGSTTSPAAYTPCAVVRWKPSMTIRPRASSRTPAFQPHKGLGQAALAVLARVLDGPLHRSRLPVRWTWSSPLHT